MFGSNPNTIPLKTVWSKVFQITRFKAPVYKMFATERLLADLEEGDTVKRTYASTGRAKTMGSDGSYSPRALTNTEESLQINIKDEYSFTFPAWERLLAHMPDQEKYSQIAARELMRRVDAKSMGTLYSGAGSSVDDGDIGGTSGNSISPSATNIADIFIAAGMKLRLKNAYFDPGIKFEGQVTPGMPVAAISPQMYAKLISYLGGKVTQLGDVVSQSGHAGKFDIFNIFVSNSLPATVVFSSPSQPNDADTVTINGVVFTFKTTLGSTAGNVLIGGSADVARANLAALINDPTTTTANGVALSQANQDLLDGMIATNDNTADTLTLQANGWNNLVVAASTNGASWGTVTQHNIFGVSESIDVVMKKTPGLDINPVSRQVAKDFVFWDLYGQKVFADQAPGIVDVKVLATGFTQPSMP